MNDSDQKERFNTDIAIIGMACRFPGASNTDEFWKNLSEGIESITFFSKEELLVAGIDAGPLDSAHYVRAAGIIEDIEKFDAAFFGFTARDAEILNPQHRLFLEQAWVALEHAGYTAHSYPGIIGMYAGASANEYLSHLYSRTDLLESMGEYQINLGNENDFLPTRVSYKLNLKGPGINVQTACSTSLVAVHLACQSLLNGECDMALAGGISLTIPQQQGYVYREGDISSPDGHCRAFDAQAQGTVGGSGVGVVVLKRLSDALADSDSIYAVIKGSAINNDGLDKIGFTAPSIQGQAEVIAEALAIARIPPETVTYIEAHGTGTILGDPIEVAALTQAFRASTPLTAFCALGSVKTNIGHLDTAAGIAGLLKTVLALKHRQLPPSLHFQHPNPKLNLETSPFYVNTTLRNWDSAAPRCAGVSSFGIGGTNAHVVLEEPPQPADPEPSRPWQVLLLSAKTATALEVATSNLAAYLRQHTDLPLADIAYTLQVGRQEFAHRRFLLCQKYEDALLSLDTRDAERLFTASDAHADTELVFMFPGGGAQYLNMGRQLYEIETTFRHSIDTCATILQQHLGLDLRHLLYPTETQSAAAAQKLLRPSLGLPALFAVSYSLARLWFSWGVQPTAMIGHSLGEYTAACLAGVFSLEDALALVVLRGRLFEQLPAGAMLSVPLPYEEIVPLLGTRLSLAAVNERAQCIVSGAVDAIAELQTALQARQIETRDVHISVAAHSAMVDSILPEFTQLLQKVRLQPPSLPYISNVTGTWITAAEATDPHYWAKHLRQTVQFAAGIETLLQHGHGRFLEVGPGQTLRALVLRIARSSSMPLVLSSTRHPKMSHQDLGFLLTTLGRLWLSGLSIDWAGFYQNERRQRRPLPTYPFERQRYWIEKQSVVSHTTKQHAMTLQRNPNYAEWGYRPSWKQSFSLTTWTVTDPPVKTDALCWLIFLDEYGLGVAISEQLQARRQHVVMVYAANHFARRQSLVYTLQPEREEDYDHLMRALAADQLLPDRVIHLWNVAPHTSAEADLPQGEATPTLAHSFYSLLFLARALERQKVNRLLRLAVISTQLHSVTGAERLCPSKATLLAPCKVIPQEYPHIICCSIDLDLSDVSRRDTSALLSQALLHELDQPTADQVVAYRGRYRWVQTYEQVPLPSVAPDACRFRHRGVYLLTGGLGGMGLGLAEALAVRMQARLVLVGRSEFPPVAQWPTWENTYGHQDATSRKIRQLQRITELGGEVLVMQADVGNLAQMSEVLVATQRRFGALHGVIHAAGLVNGAGFRTIFELQRQDCEQVLLPKTQGLYVLDQVLRGYPLDFCLLQSSISSVLGGLEFVAYAAANMFMDAFIHRYKADQPAWISVNWDGWQPWDTFETQENASPLPGATLAGLSMNAQEGLDIIERVLAVQAPQIVISIADLQARINQWVKLESLHDVPSQLSHEISPASPHDMIEETLLSIWQALFGSTHIDICDNFFELGGHSLLAIQALAKMNQAFDANISLTQFFQAPTIQKIADYLKANTLFTQHSQISSRVPAEYYPLSTAQRSFFMLYQIAPASTAYNTVLTFQIDGNLNIVQMQNAFQKLVQHYEVLRTSFALVDGSPMQRIHEEGSLVWQEFICREEELTSLLQRLVTPFDMTQAPLLHVALIHIAEKKYVLLIDMHHIITDGISVNMLLDNLQAFYCGEVVRTPRLHYADFAAWQQSQTGLKRLQMQEAYWLGVFPDLPPILHLPTDYVRAPDLSFAGASLEMPLSPEIVTALRQFAMQQGVTLYMFMLAALNVLLALYTGQEDIVIGCPVAGRTHADVQDMLGVFVNVLPLRNKPSSTKTFAAFLLEVRDTALQAYEHQDYPFEQLVSQLQCPRDTSRNPLFDMMLDFVVVNTQPLSLSDCRMTPFDFVTNTAKFDLSIDVIQTNDDVTLMLEYKTSLFETATIERMAKHFTHVIEQVITNPMLSLGEIVLEPQAIRESNQQAFNSRSVAYPQHLTVDQLFVQQVDAVPDAVALVLGDEHVTYAMLHSQSNCLARLLQADGAQHGDCIPIIARRSLSMIVALLAVLKIGAAYIPVDPTYPVARVRHILQESQASVILASAGVLSLNEYQIDAHVIDLDHIPRDAFAYVPSTVRPADIAYVIYTSGTSGRPKGVLVSHANLVNMCFAWKQEYGLATFDMRLLQVASFAFDLFTADVMRALTCGGCLILCPQGAQVDLPQLSRLIEQQAITIFEATPALVAPLFNYCAYNGYRFEALRILTLGSDAFYAHEYEGIRATLPDTVRIINSYGVTEGTIDSCYFIDGTPEMSSLHTLTVPIGRPFPNIQLYVLNDILIPQPCGIPGELYIGGAGVTYGYLHLPAQTAAAFLPNPFLAGERMYKTGDQARILANGAIELLGRKDDQIELGGYRIELAEIEAQLLSIEQIEEAVVVCKATSHSQKYLCAYVVANPDMSVGTIKSILSTRLPGYMIPARIFHLESLPVTINGKIDRGALQYREDDAAQEEAHTLPKNPLEVQLVAIWRDILARDSIGTTDSFFDLGGTSLLILALFNRINQEVDAHISVADLFSHHTIEMLAAKIQPDHHDREINRTVVQENIDKILTDMQSGKISISEAEAALDILQLS